MNLRNLVTKKENLLTIILLGLPFLLLIIAALSAPNFLEENADIEIVEEDPEPISPFKDIDLIADSAIVKDLNTGEIIFAKNSGKVLPLASITKILTALTAKEITKSNTASIRLEDLALDGNNFLFPGEVFDQKDLIDFTLIGSSNDAASAIAASAIGFGNSNTRSLFVNEMNKLAEKIGMENSTFNNETGLDDEINKISGADGTVRDVATLFEYVLENEPDLLYPTSFNEINIKSINGFYHRIENTNDILGELPNILASKTGFTNLAGGNLAVIIDPSLNRPLVLVVLGSTEEGRFVDIAMLAQKSIEYFEYNK